MQASTAKNETRLPRAVLRISESVQARIDQRNAERGLKADPVDPNAPAQPTQPTTTTVDPTTGEPSVPAITQEKDISYWQRRCASMDGRIKAEARTYQAEIDRLRQQVTELTEQIRTLQASAPAPKIDVGEFLTPEQVEALGEEQAQAVVEAAMKATRKQVDATIAVAIKPLQDADTQRREADLENRKQKFVATLTELVPDYPELDVSDGWLEWLKDVDQATGLLRQELLDTHIRRANAHGAAKLFEAYRASLPKAPAPPVAPSGSAAGQGGDVMPPDTQGLTRPTPAEITAFYTRASTKRKGQPGYVTDQERVAFEKRLKLPASR